MLSDIIETSHYTMQYVPWNQLFPGMPSGIWDTTLVFNSNAELQAMFEEAGEIDFTNQTLLVCGGGTHHPFLACTSSKRLLKVFLYICTKRM